MEFKFEYPIKGITLTMSDMMQIDKYYEAACTAQTLMHCYPERYDTVEKAMETGYEVRRQMSKYDYDEDEAICIVMDKEDSDEGDDEEEEFEPLETALFNAGREAIEDFLGYSLSESEDKDVTAQRIWEAHDSMPEDKLVQFKKKYMKGTEDANV